MSGTSEDTSTLRLGVCLPFVEGRGAFLSQHGESTVNGAAVLAGRGIHEARFDNVHRRGHDGCAEACTEGSGEVARQIIWANTGEQAERRPSAAFSAVTASSAAPHLSSGHT